MTRKQFSTPQEAESAFYAALEAANLEAMMAVWASDEYIVCIHPQGPRLTGYEAVLESWRGIFAHGRRLKVQIANQHCFRGTPLSIHVVHEFVSLANEPSEPHPIVATNVYALTDLGWRMILHHASPAPGTPLPEDGDPSESRILH